MGKSPIRGWAALICLLSVLLACSGKKRNFGDESGALLPAAGASGMSGTDAAVAADSLPAGARCTSAVECGSGSCVDGVCCQTSCDTVCTRCDAPGREGECTVAANDPACSVSCPDSTECRSYGSNAASANCEAAGLCRSVTECAATDAPSGTTCAGGAGACDGLGECIVTGLKRLGEGCAGDAECGEGHCIVAAGGASICCDSACNGLCRVCGAGGRCDEPPRDDARCQAVDCPDDDICRDYPEDITVNLCRAFGTCRSAADCTPTELRQGAECTCGAAGCTLAAGAACAAPDECASTHCEPTTGGPLVCCAEACAASGQICAATGSGCVECDGTSVACEGATSRACNAGVLTVTPCGDGCNAETGLCNDLRATGTGCEVAAQCVSGACSLDVTGTNRCCDSGCEASGRVCGTDGTCVCPASMQDVAGTCRLVDGGACVAGTDCASGACVATVAGPSICCATSCPGAFCSADGSACVECEGAGSTCAGNTAQRCENGDLVENPCGNGCDPSTGVCTGLLGNGQGCANNAQCGTNLCSPDLAGTARCCTPNCAATGRVCGVDGSCVCPDPTDVFIRGACRGVEGQACAADGDCRSDACESTQSGGAVCCTGACNGQICRQSGQGCVQCDGGPPSCQGSSSRTCVNNAFFFTTCANGCNTATGLCGALIPQGGTGCTQGNQCAGSGSSCQGGRCCEFDCAAAGRQCNTAGVCECPGGTTAVGGACLLGLGQACERSDQCASGRCDQWFRDADGDLHGDPAQSLRRCGTTSSVAPAGYVAAGDDCCDTDDLSNPDQATPSATANACGSFDYNCDRVITNTSQFAFDRRIIGCDQLPDTVEGCTNVTFWQNAILPGCGEEGVFAVCSMSTSMGVPTTTCNNINGGARVNRCF